MIDPWEYVRSIEWVLLLWVVSVAIVSVMTVRALRRFQWSDVSTIAREEDGAAYSLSYAMAMPIYIFLCLMIVEMTMITLAKVGSVYAAYAAARDNIVYRSLDAGEESSTAPRARRAAVRAMAPYGSSEAIHASDGRPSAGGEQDAQDYAAAAKKYAPDLKFNDRAIRAGYLYADKATTVDVSKPGKGANDLVEATVTYRVPLRMPVAAAILGKRSPGGGKYFVTNVKSSVKLPDETPQTPDGKLGITYTAPP